MFKREGFSLRISREQLCEAVHKEIERLELRRGKPTSDLPKNGVYFWYEEGEIRVHERLRVTRVGINEKPSRLHERIKQHFGNNREGSAFRKHLGGSLMGRNGESASEIKEWYKARKSPRFNDPKFRYYESLVTNQAQFGCYRVLKVDDDSERMILEEKLIALFSKCNHCRPSTAWLGNWAFRREIRDSGLWNVEHTFSINEFTEEDLPRLRRLVTETLKIC
jgi:hypothetical protein